MQHAKMIVGLALLALGIGGAHAGGSATITSGNGGDNVLMEYDGNRLSMGVGGGSDRMILRDGKMYMVTGNTVIDAGGMMGMIGKQVPSVGPDDVDEFTSLKATGRSETVAGVKGEVHVLTYVDSDGQTKTKELVLSSDRQAVELSKAMSNMALTMAKLINTAPTDGSAKFEAALKGKGLLRADKDFKVLAFGKAPPDSRFELPSAPQAMPNLQGLLGGGGGDSPKSENSGQGILGGLFGQKAERQQDRVEQRTSQEIDEATDSVVDKAMDKAFGKLFGK